jgi:hypothetical protein
MKLAGLLFYGLDILSKIPSPIVEQQTDTLSLWEVSNKFDKGEMSLAKETHRLILAKAMVNAALMLAEKPQ